LNYEELVKEIQLFFTDGLVLIIGSGLSAAEGIPGMKDLATFYSVQARTLPPSLLKEWKDKEALLNKGIGLEAALLQLPPSDDLELWIVRKTVEFISAYEQKVLNTVFVSNQQLMLQNFLQSIRIPSSGLPIITTNYDRLVEVSCELAGLHVDTTTIGNFFGRFDHKQSCMSSCKGIISRSRITMLDHFPRAIILKPHGSLDWYRIGNQARKSTLNLDCDRLIITPGLNKYRAGYYSPFDMHRELANTYIDRSSKILVIGYGFNDDHLQTHLVERIIQGNATLILNMGKADHITEIVKKSPRCIYITKLPGKNGSNVLTRNFDIDINDNDLWNLNYITNEVLR
jgi:hypothetical protein